MKKLVKSSCNFCKDKYNIELKFFNYKKKKKGESFFCSKECFYKSIRNQNYKEVLYISCKNCYKIFNKKPKERLCDFRKKIFCSKSCAASFNNKNRKIIIKNKSKNKKNNYKNNKIKKFYLFNYIKSIIIKNNITYLKDIRKINSSLYWYILRLKTSNKIKYKYIIIEIEKIKLKNRLERMNDIKTIAYSCTNKEDFYKKHRGYYEAARFSFKDLNPNFFSEITCHMKTKGDKFHRGVYLLIFPSVSKIYIGLTFNFTNREKTHRKNSHNKDIKKLMSNKIPYEFRPVSTYLKREQANKIEILLIAYYKQNTSYIVLNKDLGGGSGTKIKYSLNEFLTIAKKFNSYSDFYSNKKLYNYAKRNKWLNTIRISVFNLTDTNGYIRWSIEKLFSELDNNQYPSWSSFYKSKAYDFAQRKKIISKIKKKYFPEALKNSQQKYPKDINELKKIIKINVLKYNEYTEFRKKEKKLYRKCCRTNLIPYLKSLFS